MNVELGAAAEDSKARVFNACALVTQHPAAYSHTITSADNARGPHHHLQGLFPNWCLAPNSPEAGAITLNCAVCRSRLNQGPALGAHNDAIKMFSTTSSLIHRGSALEALVHRSQTRTVERPSTVYSSS